jgi:hypothetical protein
LYRQVKAVVSTTAPEVAPGFEQVPGSAPLLPA